MPFEAPPKHRIDTVLWLMIRDRLDGCLVIVAVAVLDLSAVLRFALWMKLSKPAFVVAVGFTEFLILSWVTSALIQSYRRRVAWQAYWDNVYRDGDIIRSKP